MLYPHIYIYIYIIPAHIYIIPAHVYIYIYIHIIPAHIYIYIYTAIVMLSSPATLFTTSPRKKNKNARGLPIHGPAGRGLSGETSDRWLDLFQWGSGVPLCGVQRVFSLALCGFSGFFFGTLWVQWVFLWQFVGSVGFVQLLLDMSPLGAFSELLFFLPQLSLDICPQQERKV